MIQVVKRAWFLAAVVMLLSCSSAPAQQATATSGADVAARMGDRAITIAELDATWRATNAAQHAEAAQMLYDGRRAALDQILADMLMAEAAKGKGLSPDAFAESEIAKRVKPVTDAEVVTFYQSNLDEMQGRSLGDMATTINRFLGDRQRQGAREALIAELRKAGPTVRVALAAPRSEVTVETSDPAMGSASAPVTVVEFSDFQCPFCQRVAPTLKQVRAAYGEKVRVIWKDFPLTQIHPHAFKAGEAAHCAGDQGKYWEYHDQLFANQQALQPADLKKHAADLGLDGAAFAECLDGSKYGERVRDGVAQGSQLGVNSTPTVYINGRRLSGAQPYDAFAAVIDEELSSAP